MIALPTSSWVSFSDSWWNLSQYFSCQIPGPSCSIAICQGNTSTCYYSKSGSNELGFRTYYPSIIRGNQSKSRRRCSQTERIFANSFQPDYYGLGYRHQWYADESLHGRCKTTRKLSYKMVRKAELMQRREERIADMEQWWRYHLKNLTS